MDNRVRTIVVGSHNTSLGLSAALLGILTYFFLVIGALAIMLLEKKNMWVLFHAWQSFIVGTFAIIVQFIFAWNSTLLTLCWMIYLAFTAVMIAIVIKDSPNQSYTKCKSVCE